MVIATLEDLKVVQKLVYETIQAIYPNYYPQEVVEFFINHHSEESITQDIQSAKVYLLFENNECVGTGTIDGEYMNRVFVSPNHQRKGYGSKIMDFIENEISMEHDRILLDSSLPAFKMYIKRGYKAIEYYEETVGSGRVLCYHLMEKEACEKAVSYSNLNNRVFKSVSNTKNGEVSSETIFNYFQKRNYIWASYSGGEINKGFLIGKFISEDQIYFTYQHINEKEEIRCGECRSTLEYLPDGRLRLNESWQWLDFDKTYGSSVVEEVIMQ